MEVALSTEGLTRRFGNVLAVDGLTLEVPRGEIFGFLGPNGAGKTTTIRMVAGLLRPTTGTVRVFGEDVSPRHPEARARIGLCPQENVIYPHLTTRENLEYAAALYQVPRGERRARAEALLAKLDLADKSKALAESLSGGMKRRLTLALALVHDPPVVVLDEPEAGLDPQTRVTLREFIRDLKHEKTVVLTSHNMDEVERLADRVAIVDHGKLLQIGSPAELKSRFGAGDAVEITLAHGAPAALDALRASGFAGATLAERTITVRGLDLARRFPDIVQVITTSGAALEDVRYRGNTLEDVFIELTGRGLRE